MINGGQHVAYETTTAIVGANATEITLNKFQADFLIGVLPRGRTASVAKPLLHPASYIALEETLELAPRIARSFAKVPCQALGQDIAGNKRNILGKLRAPIEVLQSDASIGPQGRDDMKKRRLTLGPVTYELGDNRPQCCGSCLDETLASYGIAANYCPDEQLLRGRICSTARCR
jgi:hypothetical protein